MSQEPENLLTTAAAPEAAAAPAAESQVGSEQPGAQTTAPTTARDAIKEAFKTVKEGATETPAAVAAKARGEDGKFKPGDKTQAPRAAGVPAQPAPKQASANPADKSLDPTKPVDGKVALDAQAPTVPATWGTEAKALFPSLPPAVQKEVARLESERSKAVGLAQQESADVKKRFGDLDQTFQSHNQRLSLRGEAPAACAKRLMDMDAIFDRDPVAVIKHLMQLSRVTPQHLTPSTQNQGTSREDLDPALVALQDQVGRMTQAEQQRADAQKAEIARQSQQTIEAFKGETDEQGQSKYPHMDKLEQEIAFEVTRLINADKRGGKQLKPMADYLKNGYEAAVWADPTLREEQLNARVAASTAQKVREQAEQAERAQKAGRASVRGGSGAPTPTAPTVRSAIKEAFQAAGAP